MGRRSAGILLHPTSLPGPGGLGGEARNFIDFLANTGITAWQMLHRKAKVRTGQTILVHGANGGVGSVLIQLARAAGLPLVNETPVPGAGGSRIAFVHPKGLSGVLIELVEKPKLKSTSLSERLS